MKIDEYYRTVLVPANSAVSAIRRAGLYIDVDRVRELRAAWTKEVVELERYVEGVAAERGFRMKYSESHSIDPETLAKFLYGAYGLEPRGKTKKGAESTGDEALAWYASLSVPRDEDDPVVKAVLKIRSLGGALSKYLEKFETLRRADGCVHPHFNWTLRTARLSAENPPVHQIPERADKSVADAVKSCIAPRKNPAPSPDEWDPRVHGSCFRWDIAGAEAAIRLGVFAKLFCPPGTPLPAWEYIREGKDIHGRTAALIYGKPEGTYKKGSYERDVVGKQSLFANIYGAKFRTGQAAIWRNARVWMDDPEAQRIYDAFHDGYPEVRALYERDKHFLGAHGYCEDAYGRRRKPAIPATAAFVNGRWSCPREDFWGLEKAWHIAANTPTQSTNATDCLWALALCYHGEYLDLQVPPMWEQFGIPWPEAADWQLHEGDGPGGKPLLAWHTNTVHDSGWGDCAPGHLEPAAKVVWRRCTSLPLDLRLQADVPYRIDLQAGPNMAALQDYNKVAAKFGLDPMPKR